MHAFTCSTYEGTPSLTDQETWQAWVSSENQGSKLKGSLKRSYSNSKPLKYIQSYEANSVVNDQVTGHLSLITGNYAMWYLARVSKFFILIALLMSKKTEIGLKINQKPA